MQSFREGSVALVQGASRGIGLGLCERLLGSGRFARVYAASRGAETAYSLAELQTIYGDALVPVAMDVAREADIAAAAESIAGREDRLDLLVNTSGVLHDDTLGMWPEKRLEDINVDNLERSFRINAFAPLLMARYFHRLLAHTDKAVFASLSARVGSIEDNGFGGWYAYRGSKAAQNMFTRTIAIELARRARNVVVLALHPGTTDTELSGPFQRRVPEGKLFSVEFVAERLLGIIDGATTEETGRFYAWDGQSIPW